MFQGRQTFQDEGRQVGGGGPWGCLELKMAALHIQSVISFGGSRGGWASGRGGGGEPAGPAMFSYLKLVPPALFVVISLKLLFIYFVNVNVIKLSQSGRNFKSLLAQIATLIMTSIILIKLFGFFQERWLTYLFRCVVNFYCCKFQDDAQALGLSLSVIWNIIWPFSHFILPGPGLPPPP